MLKRACLPALTEPSSITRNLEHAIGAFKDAIVRNTVEFKNEQFEELQLVSSVIDCTVVEISGPAMPFNRRDVFTRENTRDTVSKRRLSSTFVPEQLQ